MSVKIGYLNDKYSYENLNTYNNILRLNSFNDSNIILLNHDVNSTQDVFLNFKNIISTGLSSDTYSFMDVKGSSNIMTINNSNISLDKPVMIQDELYISDVFSAFNGATKITSNMEVHLKDSSDSFAVYSSNDVSKILFMTNDFSIIDVNDSNRMNVTDTRIDMSKNVYISNGTLFVDKISSIGPNLNIENASYSSTSFESTNSVNSIDIVNSIQSPDTTSFSIFKNYGNTNIVSINTCNIFTDTVSNNFTINNNGLIGIGTKTPSASIDIRKVHDNVILYDGIRTGDLFKITQVGDVGIGISDPKAQLHIKRNDDSLNEDNDDNRNTPLILCDIDYEESLNTSNVYVPFVQQLYSKNTTNNVKTVKMKLYKFSEETSSDNVKILVYYLLNDDILNSSSGNTIQSAIDELKFYNGFDIFETTQQTFSLTIGQISIKITIKYPFNYIEGNVGNSIAIAYDGISSINNTLTVNLLMSDDESATYDAQRVIHSETITNINSDTFDIVFNLGIQTSILKYNVKYDIIRNQIIPCPNFMHMIYNDTFVSSLSASGTLSLGEEMPTSYNHFLYVKGSSMIESLDVNNVYTSETNCNISLMDTNVIDVNRLQCSVCDAREIIAESIDEVYSIYSSNAIFSNLNASNITFDTCTTEFLSFSDTNIHLKTQVSIGDEPDLTSYDSELQINVSDRVVAGNFIQDNGGVFQRHIGMYVSTTLDTINPCISISSGTNSIPSLNFNNNDRSYNFRIKKTEDSAAKKETRFQLTSDNIYRYEYYNSDEALPSIIQHTYSEIIDDGSVNSILTFGEQNIMSIDCKNKAEYENGYLYNNHSSKITMGIPYASSDFSQEKDYVSDYLTTSLFKGREYLLNVFGNVAISDICDYPIMTMKSLETTTETVKNYSERRIYAAINGEPDESYNLKVYGNIACDKIYLHDKNNTLKDLITMIIDAGDWSAFRANFTT